MQQVHKFPLALARQQKSLDLFPQIVTLETFLLWNSSTPIIGLLRYLSVFNSWVDYGLPVESYSTVLHTDPHPSPVPDSGNLRPARFIIPQQSLPQPAPVLAPQNSTSHPTHPPRLPHPSRPRRPRRRRRKPQISNQSCVYALEHTSERTTTSTPRSRTTTVIRLAPRPPDTRDQLGSWTHQYLHDGRQPLAHGYQGHFLFCTSLTTRADHHWPYASRMIPGACPIP